MATAVVIGGGIVGLSSAYYLQQEGFDVTIVDRGDFSDNCSYGNAGYVCPSHFVPLASPGIISQGLRWMLNPESPFYIKPRLDWGLISWGLKFVKHATPQNVAKNAVPLRDIALLSKKLYEDWLSLPGFEFAYQRKGLLEYFQTAEKEHHAHHTVKEALALGLAGTRVLTADEVQAMEPQVKLNIKGALYFECDAHLHPNAVMQQMQQYLRQQGVRFLPHATATEVEKQGNRITKVKAGNEWLSADVVVIATGSWSREVAKLVNVSLPLVGGRGYSMVFGNGELPLQHPAVLMEGRVALTPFDALHTRLGGTMEITNLDAPPRMNRVLGIVKAAQGYFPESNIPTPELKDVWYGYRPCSADGMPFIGRTEKYGNCIVATGHAMVGMSLGAATGKLVSELAAEKSTSVDLAPYAVHRFD
ncbi:NAD(P)/FAD-dependent oxidoreductase [Phnomibacter ginsenosidimutans]|uniref:FAD-dependent oxidoreductase n=1 Tax=Phnomibacter ginsenosidimutans TaxID=2676868 RepID=A0A6I6GR87_9BACT|nr:FAD-dependent oxidoreductase [Phnomibacter ginsenosidimutans]QGW27579.1 FAD-dependent oxidoreductase [Phnomibacter ginsenosidimutans]